MAAYKRRNSKQNKTNAVNSEGKLAEKGKLRVKIHKHFRAMALLQVCRIRSYVFWRHGAKMFV